MMILKQILQELIAIRKELSLCNENIDRIIKRISILHNSENIANPKPLAWLTPEQRIKAYELKKENPETYKYVTELLKLFVGRE